ncbi:hypothetical protein CROQUDRAFT_94887 [Cronartium quercuum f. sp. fusiforme G11]|uniref:Uncharacterized protein n=1 Tax=Cronartium quercuum f. sp. fusiforme G11 TaxID=708437 RepID=A0A9P6NDB6_9BASI|nr:hypothetical protein CROQUDRAFT_94887 [Cronartium quercuum f. sp. fusiforme G11]
MALENNDDNPAWDPEDSQRDMPIMGISISDLSEEFYDGIKSDYLLETNTVKLVEILQQEHKSLELNLPSYVNSLPPSN